MAARRVLRSMAQSPSHDLCRVGPVGHIQPPKTIPGNCRVHGAPVTKPSGVTDVCPAGRCFQPAVKSVAFMTKKPVREIGFAVVPGMPVASQALAAGPGQRQSV